jgi:hypothetical protein
MLSAYSRDPNLLFSSHSSPNYFSRQSRYKNVTLKIKISDSLPANTHIYEAIVDWYNSKIQIFLDSDDSLNNVPYFEGNFYVPCVPRSAETYVRETFQFLARGHSVHHPMCTCSSSIYFNENHNYYDKNSRLSELGLFSSTIPPTYTDHQHHQNYYYNQPCCLETNGCGKEIDDVAKELGIVSLQGKVNVTDRLQMPLIDVLTKLAGMDLTKGSGLLFCSQCCIPLIIQSAQDILAAAKAMYPKPYSLDCTNTKDCENQSLIKDLELLKRRSLVRAVDGPTPNTFSVFYFNAEKENKLILNKMVDKYIQSLWHQDAKTSCSFFHGPSLLEVERMLQRENIKPMQVVQRQLHSDIHTSKKAKKKRTSTNSMMKMVQHLKHFRKQK